MPLEATNFTTGEKNRAQNCLTVSNIKLDDVFSDVFVKAASAVTTRLLQNPSVPIIDVSAFRTKGMKATNAEVLAAADGEMCVEQAEKLPVIRSHMDRLDLCKANLESLILFVAEKYLPQLGLVMTQNNESAGKKKTTRIGRAGAYIKALLVQCALCAIHAKQNPEIRSRYLSLKNAVDRRKLSSPLPECG